MSDVSQGYSILNYTHSDPLFESMRRAIPVLRGKPGENLEDVLDGRVGAAVVSLLSYFYNSRDLERIPATNIHTLSTTGSTLLISRGDRMRNGMKIAVTAETETTSKYLGMALDAMNIKHTMLEADQTSADDLLNMAPYALVIGDEALRVYGSNFRILIDVGYEFSRLFHMGPVYAVSVRRRDSSFDLPDLRDFVKPSRAVVDDCSVRASGRLSVPRELISWYYSLIMYDENRWVDASVSKMEAIFNEKGEHSLHGGRGHSET